MPDTTIAIAIMLGSFVLLLMARMPISFTLGISSVLTALYLNIPLAVSANGQRCSVLLPAGDPLLYSGR